MVTRRRQVVGLLGVLIVGTIGILLFRDGGAPGVAASSAAATPSSPAARPRVAAPLAGGTARPTPSPSRKPAQQLADERSDRLLVTGQLVDDLGQPLHGFVVEAHPLAGRRPDQTSVELPRAPSKRRSLPIGARVVTLHEPNTDLAPITVENIEMATSSDVRVVDAGDGRFEVRGRTTAAWLQLVAKREQRVLVSGADVGTRGMRWVIPRVGRVQAVLRHNQEIPGSVFLLRLRPDDPEAPLHELQAGRLDREGHRRFDVADVPLGTYTLEVALAETGTPPLFSIGGVTVAAQPIDDPRLRDIDVRGRCRRIEVRLRRPDGRPIGVFDYVNVQVEVQTPQGEILTPAPKLRQSKLVITTGHPYVNLHLALERYQPVELEHLRSSQVVTLQERQ
ncbi:MAG: hypothetical protein AAF628_00545 [Planctomycetota bacterium]